MTRVVRENPAASRYEIEEGGRVVGFLDYQVRDGVLALLHAEVEPAVGGRGVGTELVRETLRDARLRGIPVLPLCPFVRAYLAKHPEDRDLVPPAEPARFWLLRPDVDDVSEHP